MQCVILAGGLGTRMRPYTQHVPKLLIEAHGQPFAHYQLCWLAQQGVNEVVYCIGHKGQMIRDYVGEGTAWGLDAVYVDEGEQLRGTGGAVQQALEARVLRDAFLVLYGDSFLPIPFGPFWRDFQTRGCEASMTILRNEGRWDTSNVIFQDDQVVLYDKRKDNPNKQDMQHIDYGLLAFRRRLVESEAPGRGRAWDLADLLHRLSIQDRLGGFEVNTRFFEIGSMAGLRELSSYIARTGFGLKSTPTRRHRRKDGANRLHADAHRSG